MKEVGIDVSEDKPHEIREMFKEHFAFVITLSDPKDERTPVWPFTRNLVHWKLPDPLEPASLEDRREALRRVRDEIGKNVRDFASQMLPQLKVRAAGR
jgi:protein-tyrosine-phosphatase